MGVHFVQQSRSAEKQNLKDVSTDRALLYIARKRENRSPEELTRMEHEVRSGEFVIYGGYFNDIRTRNREKFRTVEELLVDQETNAGKLKRALTLETTKELRCWAQNNANLQGLTDYFHPAQLLQPDLDPEFRALQLGYLYLAVLGQRTHHQQQGLLDPHEKPTSLLLERIHHAVKESALSPYLNLASPAPHQLTALPEDEPWRRGALQSLYLDYLTDGLVLAATQGGLELDSSQHLSPFSEGSFYPGSDYIPRTLQELGKRLDSYIERSDTTPTKGASR